MSLKLSHSLNHAPFFPPGISHLKVPSKDTACKRPLSVKECKILSKSKPSTMATSLTEYNDPQTELRRFSKSTPNLKVCHFADRPTSFQQKDNGKKALVDQSTDHYGSGYFTRSCYSSNMTRSLDQLPGLSKSKSLTGFKPDKPFYPPSKYPSIHDTHNSNLQKLIETREKYKTPKSRETMMRLSRTQSMNTVNRKKIKERTFSNVQNYGSLPDLNKKAKTSQLNAKKKIDKQNADVRSNKISENLSDKKVTKHPDEIFTGYFYPNDDVRKTNDIMAQSLQLERSLASMIGTGSLNRASRGTEYQPPQDVADIDDKSTKSMTEPKLLNSFSQDSLDCSKRTKKDTSPMDVHHFAGINDDEISQNSECDVSTTMSPIEDDHQKGSSPGQPKEADTTHPDYFRNNFSDYLQCNGDLDQYNIDQVTNHNFQPVTYIDKSSPIVIRNEFLCNVDQSESGNEAGMFMEDLESGHIINCDQINNGSLLHTCEDDRIFEDTNQHLMDFAKDTEINNYHCGTENQLIQHKVGSEEEEHELNVLNDLTSLPDINEFNHIFPSTEGRYNTEPCVPSNDNITENIFEQSLQYTDAKVNATLDEDFDKKIIANLNTELPGLSIVQDQKSSNIMETDQFYDQTNPQLESPRNDFEHSMECIDENLQPHENDDDNYVNIRNLVEPDLLNDHLFENLQIRNGGDAEVTGIDAVDRTQTLETEQYYEEILLPDNDGLPQSRTDHRNDHHKYDSILTRDEIDTDDYIEVRRRQNREYSSLFEGNTDHSQHVSNFVANLNARFSDGSSNSIGNVDVANLSDLRTSEQGDMDSTASSSANDLSWSRYDENKSFITNMSNSVKAHHVGVSWLSSPELRSANFTGRDGRHTQIDNPLKPLCNYCRKPAYFMERISISNIIFHKSCFRCRKCQTHLNFNNCIIHHKRAYCQVHMKPKIRKSLPSASTNKLNQIKEKLDHKSNINRDSNTEMKPQRNIIYGGIQSAKTKFFEDASKANDLPNRDQRRITPPRQGVNYGIIESDPKPRDPNVIACGDYQSSYTNDISILTQSCSTKETRAHFKDLQNKSQRSKDSSNGDTDETTRIQRLDIIPVDTKSLRNRFLLGSNDSDSKLKKINPSDEIRRLVELESNTSFPTESGSNTDNLLNNAQGDERIATNISRCKAKEMKERFTNIAQDDVSKKPQFKLEYGEGGIYESNPQENDEEIVKHNYDTTIYLPKNTVKSGLQKIKDLQDIKSKGYQKSNNEPIKMEVDSSTRGIYESTPEQSKADSVFNQNEDNLREFQDKNYTNDAKKVLIEKQRLEEEASMKRSTPHMIDIWGDLCPNSGVFENKPSEQRQDVVKCNDCPDKLIIGTQDSNCGDKEWKHETEEIGEANESLLPEDK